MGAQECLTRLILPCDPQISSSLRCDGKGNESNEGHGSHEGDEGHEEEARLCKNCRASHLRRQTQQDQRRTHSSWPCDEQAWKGCEQEAECQGQAVPLDRSSAEGPCGSQDQGFLSHQEGHTTLRQGEGELQPVNALSNLRGPKQGHLLQMWGFLRL